MIREKNDLLIPNEFWFHTRYLTDSEIVAILRKSYVGEMVVIFDSQIWRKRI